MIDSTHTKSDASMLGDFDEEEEPSCPECGCDLFTEEHDWDCSYYGEDEDDEA